MALIKNDIGLDSLTKAMDDSSALVDSLKAFASYNLADVVQTSSISAAIQNPGAFTGNLTVNGSIPPPKDHLIQGEMFNVQKFITQEVFEMTPPQHLKEMMLADLLQEMMKSKHIEFTMMKDPHTVDMVRMRARVFVTPDRQVRLLRENGVI